MAKYLLLKHYRGAPAPVNNIPMDQWKPDEVDAHIKFMQDFAARLEQSGEFVDAQALAPTGMWVRYDGDGRPPATDGPFAETKEVLGGFNLIEARDMDEALEIAKQFPWSSSGCLEVRPVRDSEMVRQRVWSDAAAD